MNLTRGFYDYCIPFQNDRTKLIPILKEALLLGYRTVAIEQVFDYTPNDGKKSNDIFPLPIDLEFAKEFQGKLRILQRLTITYSDVGVTHRMVNSLNLKKFDIIAGQPKTEAALNHCFTTFIGDIICFDPEGPNLVVQRKPYQIAVARDMFMEVKYSDVIQNSTLRKDIIKYCHNYHVKGKSKNIIISSGAKSVFELRSPYDVGNLALIFGLSEEQGRSSISSLGRKLYFKSESRRIGKTNMIAIVESVETSETSDDQSDDEINNTNIQDLEDIEMPYKKQKLDEK